MRQVLTAIAISLLAVPATAATQAEKKKQCQFQADLIGAVQTARLDRVKKAKASETVLAANPEWPEGAAQAMSPVVEYVYGIKRRDLKKVDLAADTLTTCLENYDQIQALKNSVEN
jgi:hypothetical protein